MKIGNLISAELKGKLYKATPKYEKPRKEKHGKHSKGKVTTTMIASACARAQHQRIKIERESKKED